MINLFSSLSTSKTVEWWSFYRLCHTQLISTNHSLCDTLRENTRTLNQSCVTNRRGCLNETPAMTQCWFIVGPPLRRWPSLKTTMVKWLLCKTVFSWSAIVLRWPNVGLMVRRRCLQGYTCSPAIYPFTQCVRVPYGSKWQQGSRNEGRMDKSHAEIHQFILVVYNSTSVLLMRLLTSLVLRLPIWQHKKRERGRIDIQITWIIIFLLGYFASRNSIRFGESELSDAEHDVKWMSKCIHQIFPVCSYSVELLMNAGPVIADACNQVTASNLTWLSCPIIRPLGYGRV